ncbi:hypothetical protein FM21_13175 [Streptomyces mutabilis]|uniref:Uncharacterized protein n=1 Tax=Streptomyces mutabilis TaxID=67332 RepID=A0A086N763_9ACTN|nr:hypothetical protein FM21_13175 [Streptomyces mutabilis]
MLARAGSKARAEEASRVRKVEPSVLPWRERVWLRLSQPTGSLSTTRSTSRASPRSTCTHCGKEPAGPSQ